MKITYDTTMDGLYIQLRDGIVEDTLEQNQSSSQTWTKTGAPLGIEILFHTALWQRKSFLCDS